MSEITLSIPDETLLALKVNPEQMGAASFAWRQPSSFTNSAAFPQVPRRRLPEFREPCF